MKQQQQNSFLSGGSEAYLEDLYEQYLANPSQLDPAWRSYFESLPSTNGNHSPEISHAQTREMFQQMARAKRGFATPAAATAVDSNHERKQSRVIQMIHAFRSHGHHQAQLDPLELTQRPRVADLSLEHHHLSIADLKTEFNTGDFPNLGTTSLENIYTILNQTYCRHIGIEYMHITDTTQVQWIQQRFESTHGQNQFTHEQKKRILECLIAAEGMEQYLHNKYVGQKRFSLEGGDSMIALLDELLMRSGSQGTKEVVLGMAHRGRLNVLVNLLGKAPEELFKEFEGHRADQVRSGDVKYHMGFSSDIETPGGVMHLALAFNPSHLEIISPVVEGSVRARQERRHDTDKSKVIPILIHGDAAIAGQGIVMETLNMSQARGYSTGGTIHIVVNNQVGFTTSNPLDARSTLYCTDVVKMVQAPVIHVNSDDPEAVVFAAQIALDFRQQFKKDVVIDLVCYRRHGHNEADEPMMTQPLMYQKIKKHPTTTTLYAEQLQREGVLTEADFAKEKQIYRDELEHGQSVVEHLAQNYVDEFAVDWTPFLDKTWTDPGDTRLQKQQLTALSEKLYEFPESLSLQRAVSKEMDNRRKMGRGEMPFNWGAAETLAYASLVTEGHRVRLSGQDCGRGTFSHRHAVLHDQQTGELHVPLNNISDMQAPYTVIDSILSEAGVLGFEYGYSTTEPNALVIWEAQFGDFVNGAQVVIDQFISSGDQKWARLSGLVMLLPHGFEGMGPEHSSARLERFLQLAAENNIQICVPSTPAQVYHMLRRQIVRPLRKPLIVMSPKSLLRHHEAISTLDELAEGEFQLVIPETDASIKPDKVRRIVVCAGKVYYDLLDRRRQEKISDIALIRLEQLYPYPDEMLHNVIMQYPKAKEVVWCQEEPMNQGSWFRTLHHLNATLPKGHLARYAGRPASAAPACGYASLHKEQQNDLLEQALLHKWEDLTY